MELIGIGDILFLILIGLLTGFLSGYLGIGGGVVVIPALMYFLKDKVSPDNLFLTASTLALCAVFVASASASYRHIKSNNYYKESILPLATGALIGPFIGNYICGIVCDKNRILFFSLLLAVLSLRVILQKNGKEKSVPVFNLYLLFSVGLLMGIISAMTGIGGGSILVPILAGIFKFDLKKSVGVASIIMIFNSVSFLIGRYAIGGFDDISIKYFGIILLIIAIGTIASSNTGVKSNLRSNDKTYKYVAGFVYLAVSLQMFFTAI